MPTYAPETELGAFIPTTDIYDLDTIYAMDVNSQDFKDFLVRLRQSINNVALLLNIKDTGYYPRTEFICSKAWYPNPALTAATPNFPQLRQVFRKTFELGPLPDTDTISILHEITIGPDFPIKFTDIYGVANDTATYNYLPLPYSSATGNNIELRVDQTRIYITTNDDRTNFNIAYVVVEYIKE